MEAKNRKWEGIYGGPGHALLTLVEWAMKRPNVFCSSDETGRTGGVCTGGYRFYGNGV